MFGGGEEYFQDPPEIDRDTLRHYATFCARLRHLEKPGQKAIAETCALAREVGDTVQAYDLVVGAVFRHIKSWTGTKQLASWYVLDKLCKEDRAKYGFIAGKYILEIGTEYIPYEDPILGPKYESLVEHWERVFEQHVVDALWLSKKDRLWAVDHPAEVLEQKRLEEEEWSREEQALQDEDGLNDFGQPCMDFLQGRCMWGDSCRLLHPPGEENSLPPECRMGDWKCHSCGVINRHYRRRCSNCVREKPQYKKTRTVSVEDALLSNPDTTALQSLRKQFGYDPYVEAEAVAHWRLRFEATPLADYLKERRVAYKVRILGKAAQTPLEEQCKAQKHFPDVDIGVDEEYLALLEGSGASKRARNEAGTAGAIPQGTAASTAIALLSQMVMERGVRDAATPQLFSDLGRQVRRLAGTDGEELSEPQAEVFMSAAKLGFTAWNASQGATPFVASFFKAVRHSEEKIGLSSLQCEQLVSMAKEFLA